MAQEFKWRTATKILAILDLVLSIASLILLILGLIGILLLGGAVAEDNPQNNPNYNQQQKDMLGAALIITVISFGIALILVIIKIVAAVRLLAASKEGVAPAEAISKAKCWRILNIIILVFCILGIFGGGTPSQKGGSLVNGILCGVGVAIVTLYMKELEVAATNPQVYYAAGPT